MPLNITKMLQVCESIAMLRIRISVSDLKWKILIALLTRLLVIILVVCFVSLMDTEVNRFLSIVLSGSQPKFAKNFRNNQLIYVKP